MSVLDDPILVERIDPSDFLGVVERFPDQIRDAVKIAEQVDGLPKSGDFDSIAVLGMGGSGISGDFLAALLRPTEKIHVETIKGYELPAWVSSRTLVFAASYSGDTEESLATFERAKSLGASLICLSTGGRLGELASEHKLPLVTLPGGLMPRAALGYMTIPLLLMYAKLGGATHSIFQIDEVLDLLDRRSKQWGRAEPVSTNRAKQLAQQLQNRIPLIYGTEGIAALAAYRWKCQFNECAKVPAWSNSFPELTHNEIVGWQGLQDLTREIFALIVLRHEKEHPRNAKRIEITLPLIEKSLALVEEVQGEGDSDLSRLLDLTYFGDFVATYLAIAQDVDPAPVDVIKELKAELSQAD
jgi:glucose/mannose-6-phosphate isomerase